MSHMIDAYDYILKHGSITHREAEAAFGCSRIAARICDLKDIGVDISREIVPVTNRNGGVCHVARYSFTDRMSAVRAMASYRQLHNE